MSDYQDQPAHQILFGQLAEYGQMLDRAADGYLYEKESGVSPIESHRARVHRVGVKILASVAAAVLILGGSFAVNQFGSSQSRKDVALAWSSRPDDPSDAANEKRDKVIEACNRANPDGAGLPNVKTALDIRASLSVMVWVSNEIVDVCIASVDHDIPSTSTAYGLQLATGSDMSGVQVVSMTLGNREVSVVVGRDGVLPDDCRNLDVFTSKGIIRALRASGIFAFWYPGKPAISGMSESSIKYGCAADGPQQTTVVTPSSVVGADPFANLCIATFDILHNHGVTNDRNQALDLDNWDLVVNDEFKKRVWPIAETFKQPSTIFSTWWNVNGGALLALDATGRQRLQNREQYKAELTGYINAFASLCEDSRTRPEDRETTVMVTTTIQIRELNPESPKPTVIPG